MWKNILCTSLALAAALPAAAEDTGYPIMGAGALSCGKYVKAWEEYRPYNTSSASGIAATRAALGFWQYGAWVQGYIVGAALATDTHIRAIDEDSLYLWVYNYCQKKPIDTVLDAATELYFALGGRKAERR